MITRQHILQKTHYGLRIYSYILRQFFPNETVLYVNGRECKPTFNPFSPVTTRSLHIEIVNNIAVYRDNALKKFQGGPFDFAQLYFQEDTEDELLIKINDTLNLRLENSTPHYEIRSKRIQKALEQMPESINTSQFSYFNNNLFNVYPTKTVTLFDTYRMVINPIRKNRT